MSIWEQEPGETQNASRWYAHCFCGVVGPLRPTMLLAVFDESAHHSACSARKAAA